MRDVDLCLVLLLPPQSVVVLPDVPQLHVPLFLCVTPLVEHVGLLVLLLSVCGYCVSVDWILGPQLIRHLLRWCLILIWLFRLFPESAHVGHSWRLLCWWVFSRRLSVGCRLSLDWGWLSLLTLCGFFRLLLLWLLILGRHGIEYSRWLHLLFVLCEGRDIDGLPFILIEPFDRIF